MHKKAGYQLSLLFSVILVLSGCNGAGESISDTSTPGTGGGTATGSALVTWTEPAGRLDGSPISISEIGGYYIYSGTSSTNMTSAVMVSGGTSSQRQITGLAPGTYYFQVSAYDLQGIEGPRTALASKVIQ